MVRSYAVIPISPPEHAERFTPNAEILPENKQLLMISCPSLSRDIIPAPYLDLSPNRLIVPSYQQLLISLCEVPVL